MSATATLPAAGRYTLTGIVHGSGSCTCCGRSLKRLFRITGPDGAEGVYGSACAKKLTGWTPKVAVAELFEARRLRDAELREQGHGELLDRLTDLAAETAKWCGVAGIAGDGLEMLRGSWASIRREWYAVDVVRAAEAADAAAAVLDRR
jgi:hypothetical protein